LLASEDVKIEILNSHTEAMSSPQVALWKEAKGRELESQLAHGTWELVPQPSRQLPIGGTWIYSLKHDAEGRITKFKARWVSKGYSQQEGRDYGETFASTGKHTMVPVYAAVVAEQDLDEMKMCRLWF
jgi:hypothetical protein